MSWFSMAWNYYLKAQLKRTIIKALDEISIAFSSGSDTTIEAAKVKIAGPDGIIQSKRKVPGELRRAACSIVNRVEAKDLVVWLAVVRARVKSW